MKHVSAESHMKQITPISITQADLATLSRGSQVCLGYSVLRALPDAQQTDAAKLVTACAGGLQPYRECVYNGFGNLVSVGVLIQEADCNEVMDMTANGVTALEIGPSLHISVATITQWYHYIVAHCCKSSRSRLLANLMVHILERAGFSEVITESYSKHILEDKTFILKPRNRHDIRS